MSCVLLSSCLAKKRLQKWPPDVGLSLREVEPRLVGGRRNDRLQEPRKESALPFVCPPVLPGFSRLLVLVTVKCRNGPDDWKKLI